MGPIQKIIYYKYFKLSLYSKKNLKETFALSMKNQKDLCLNDKEEFKKIDFDFWKLRNKHFKNKFGKNYQNEMCGKRKKLNKSDRVWLDCASYTLAAFLKKYYTF